MAKTTIEVLTDDLDGSEIKPGKGSTVHFAFEGSTYEVDLSDKHRRELEKALAPYIAAARQVTGKNIRRKPARSSATDPSEIRAWARENGFPEIAEHGRIPTEVMNAWHGK